MASPPLHCVLIGGDTLLTACGDVLLAAGHRILGVITEAPRVVDWARGHGLAVIDPETDYAATLGAEPFDFLFSIANLKVVPAKALACARKGAINFHEGPVPEYAGVNTPVWAIVNGETRWAITWHSMTARLDAGDILLRETFAIAPDETAVSLNTKCFAAALESFPVLLDALVSGRAVGLSQGPTERYYGKHQRLTEAAVIDWRAPAEKTAALVRALDFGRYLNPMAAPQVLRGSEALLVTRAEAREGTAGAAPGTVVAVDAPGIDVAAGEGIVRLLAFSTQAGHEVTPVEAARQWGLAPGVHLSDLAPAERERLRALTPALSKAEPFWAHRLATLEPLELPGASSRTETPDDTRGEPAELRLELPAAFRARLADDRTAALLAAYALCLSRLARKPRFSLALADSRGQHELAGLGAVIATEVPLAAAIDPASGFEAALAGMKAELAAVRGRAPYLRDLVARHPDLRRRETLGGRRLLPVGVSIDLQGRAAEREAGRVLTLAVSDEGQAASLLYDPSVLTGQVAHDIASRLAALLTAVAKDARRPLLEVEGPAAADGQTALDKLWAAWNDTAIELPHTTVHRAIEEQVARTPDATAVVYRGDSLSYAELNRRANRVAHDLRARGVGPDVMVGIFVERSLEMVIGLLAILKAGGAYVPMDPLYPAERLSMMLEDSRAPVILTLERLRGALPKDSAQVIALDRPARAAAEDNPKELSQPEDLAYVIFTSGSTGRPKGVQIEHRNVINFFAGMDACLGHEAPGVWLAVTSISFDISVLELLWTLSRGFKVVLQEEADRAPVTSSSRNGLARKGMEFSLFYFAADAGEAPGQKYRLLLEGARYADQNGFAAVWTPERHFHAFGGLYPNPALTSAAIAVITERIEIRAGSVVLPLHNPIRAAEEWSVVDNLSGGRVGLSFASGWHAADFALAPGNYKERKKLMAEGIETVRALWRGEAVPAKSGDGKDIEVKIFPAPIQREPRIWLTSSSSPDTFALAGRIGANILTNLLSMKLEELESNVAVYRAAWREAGHRGQGHITLMLHTFVGRDLEEVKRKVRGPFLEYLRSSTDLISKARWEQSMFARPDKQRPAAPGAAPGGPAPDLADLTPEEMDAIMAHAFARYFETAGLFGTPASCLQKVETLRAKGVDEIACLIDFGVDTASVLEGLTHLNELRKSCLPREAEGHEDYSVPAQIRRHGVTHLQCTPSMARILASDEDALESLRPLRKLLLGGEALPEALAQELAPVVSGEILNMYGPTETTVWSTTAHVPKGKGRITIGRPIANTQVYVVDDALRLCPAGLPGEILIGGAGVVRGYLGRPELTAERFIQSPFTADPAARLYRTGDLGRLLPEGTLDYAGRLDHQVKIRGYRIELGEIESVVGQHPGVRACAVVVREDVPGDQRIVAYVVPRHEPGGGTARDTTSDWQAIWDETYRPAAAPSDPTFDIAGWNSSFDGAPIPAPEMREWVARTTERILALAPRRVLEIGCGTGLYLFRVAPHCEHYCGSDFSSAALAKIARQLGPLKLPQVTLREKPAHDFSGLERGAFDTVVLSSVVQYFPNVSYLLDVVEKAMDLLAPGGHLFIGDVRSLPLLERFATAVELHQAPETLPLDELERRIARRVAQERELVLDPAFFYALREALRDVGEVAVSLKRGAFANELTRFRYDVVVHKGGPRTLAVRQADFDAAASPGLTTSAIAHRLAEAPATFVVTNVLNRHVAREGRAQALLRARTPGTVADLRAALAAQEGGLTPEDLHDLAPDYDVAVTWADSGVVDCFDVSFRHKQKAAPLAGPAAALAPRRPWSTYANSPAQHAAGDSLLPELRAYVKGKLPPFMVPTAFVVLDALPLTPNGKIDRKALPAPDRARHESAAPYQAPALELERTIAAVWQELLSLNQVSTVDNLFDLGANSLLMVQATSRLRKALGRDLSLVEMFQYPTVASLAKFLGAQGEDGAADPALQESQSRGQSRREALQRRRELRSGTRPH